MYRPWMGINRFTVELRAPSFFSQSIRLY